MKCYLDENILNNRDDYTKLISNCASSTAITQVTLSSAQRQDLLKELSLFEDYFKNLSDNKREELELEKKYSLDTHLAFCNKGKKKFRVKQLQLLKT